MVSFTMGTIWDCSQSQENEIREIFIYKIAFLLSTGLASQTVCLSLESKVNKND